MLVATGVLRPESEGAGVDRREGCEGDVCVSAAMACSGSRTSSSASASSGAGAGSGSVDDGGDVGIEEVGVIVRQGRLDGVDSSSGVDQSIWGSGGCGEEGGEEEGGEEEGGEEEGVGDKEGGITSVARVMEGYSVW
jgi:hypothetical protein